MLFQAETNFGLTVENTGHISLDVFDLNGKLVKTLLNDNFEPGTQNVRWDATNESGKKIPSGIYFYQLKTKDINQVQKLILY
ncbi:MAG: FlgD immunoglobulin-like domain containing protein [Bacteroidales bacterium]